MANPVISTPKASEFMLPYTPALPHFLCTIEGFTMSIQDKEAIVVAEEVVTNIVQKTFETNKTLIMLIKSHLINNKTSQHNPDPVRDIIRALEVELTRGEDTVEQSATTYLKKPRWNIFKLTSPL